MVTDGGRAGGVGGRPRTGATTKRRGPTRRQWVVMGGLGAGAFALALVVPSSRPLDASPGGGGDVLDAPVADLRPAPPERDVAERRVPLPGDVARPAPTTTVAAAAAPVVPPPTVPPTTAPLPAPEPVAAPDPVVAPAAPAPPPAVPPPSDAPAPVAPPVAAAEQTVPASVPPLPARPPAEPPPVTAPPPPEPPPVPVPAPVPDVTRLAKPELPPFTEPEVGVGRGAALPDIPDWTGGNGHPDVGRRPRG